MELILDKKQKLQVDFQYQNGKWSYKLNGEFHGFEHYIKLRTETGRDDTPFNLEQLDEKMSGQNSFEVVLGGQVIGKVAFDGQEVTIEQEPSQQLSTYEIKTLSNAGRLPKVINQVDLKATYKPRTDLHTHMAGAVSAEDLIGCATDYGKKPFYYPIGHLEACGINVDDYIHRGLVKTSDQFDNGQVNIDSWTYPDNDPKAQTRHNVKTTGPDGKEFNKFLYLDLNQLNPEDKTKLIDNLAISSTKQIIFDDMENYYELRGIFTIDKKMFATYLEALAKDYQAQGIEYASISLTDITRSDYLAIAEKVLPELKAKYGVTITFLAAAPRLDNLEKLRNRMDQIKVAAQHPCVEGVDFLASEVNSTLDIYDAMHDICAWAQVNDPNFVLRVHAGETTYHPENVRAVLVIAKEYGVKVRVGHGIYGTDPETIRLAQELAANNQLIIEMNPDSNYSLNNIDNTADYPLVTYALAGIPVVLGSDGHGLYQTDNEQLIRHLQYLNLGEGKVEQIVSAIKKGDELHAAWRKVAAPAKEVTYQESLSANQGDIHKVFARPPLRHTFSKIKIKYDDLKNQNREATQKKWDAGNIVSDETTVKAAIEGKTPIFINISIDPNDPDSFAKSYALLKTLIDNLDTTKAYLVTNGQGKAFEPIIFDLVSQRNKSQVENPVILLGAIANDTPAHEVSTTCTHAMRVCEHWYDYHKYYCGELGKNHAQAIFVGGDMLARDMIQAGYNQISEGRIDASNNQLYIVKGPEGASTDKAEHLPMQFSCDSTQAALVQFIATTNLLVENPKQKFNDQYQNALTVDTDKLIKRQGPTGRTTIQDKVRWIIINCEHQGIKDINTNEIQDFIISTRPKKHPFYAKIKDNHFLAHRILEMLVEQHRLQRQHSMGDIGLLMMQKIAAKGRSTTPTPTNEVSSTADIAYSQSDRTLSPSTRSSSPSSRVSSPSSRTSSPGSGGSNEDFAMEANQSLTTNETVQRPAPVNPAFSKLTPKEKFKRAGQTVMAEVALGISHENSEITKSNDATEEDATKTPSTQSSPKKHNP